MPQIICRASPTEFHCFHPHSCSPSIRMRSRPVLSLPHMFSHALTTPLHPETHQTQASGLHSRLSRAPEIANVWWRRRLSANKTGCSLLWSKPRVWLIIIFPLAALYLFFFLFTSPYVSPHLCRIFYFWVVFIFARLIVPITLRSETRSALHQRDWSAFKENKTRNGIYSCESVSSLTENQESLNWFNLCFVTFQFVGMTRMLSDNEIWTPLWRFDKWKMLKLLPFCFSIQSVISCHWADLANLHNWKAGKTNFEQRWRCLPCKQMPLHMRVCGDNGVAQIVARFQIFYWQLFQFPN